MGGGGHVNMGIFRDNRSEPCGLVGRLYMSRKLSPFLSGETNLARTIRIRQESSDLNECAESAQKHTNESLRKWKARKHPNFVGEPLEKVWCSK